jgi:S-DNA-T family DNA segregation ATPase FtsK/SpoIIIE
MHAMAKSDSSKKSSSSKPATPRTTTPRTTSARGGPARGGAVRDATPPDSAARSRSQVDADDAGSGTSMLHRRRHELWGIGVIALGVLLGLAIYFDLAGPLGRGVDTVVGWLAGLGRYAVPLVLVAVGVALVRRGRSSNLVHLAIGWALVIGSALGLLHVLRGPDKLTANVDTLEPAGGWLGGLVGAPLQAVIGPAGASIVLLALMAAGVLLITRTSPRVIATRTKTAAITIGRPAGRWLRSGLHNVSTLSSDRIGHEPDAVETGGAAVYDFAQDGDDFADSGPAKRGRATKAKVSTGTQPGSVSSDGAQVGEWELPPMTFLDRPGEQAVDRKEVEARGRMLQESLASHGVDTTLVGMTVGPTVTRYELELGLGVKVARVTSLQRDIAYAMAATDVRILAPIPGRSAIGVEVPNRQRQLVALGDLLASPEAARAVNPLEVAVGKDIAGKAVFLDLAATPHLLIAGATGAGKSSALNCIITSLLMRTTPDDVRLILIDPKQVEMGQYQRLPHLLTQPVTNPKKAANALGWAVKEMERRYDLLSEMGFRDIAGYNKAFAKGEVAAAPGSMIEYEHLPYIVVIVDELNDLMMVAARDVEESITRIAQKARAVGIHLIVATQRPSVNVITGVIKANIPARMAFAVSSLTDSRVILDQPGAEKLVGKGDMLLLPGNSSVSNRIQGSFVSEDEVRQVVAHWRNQSPEPIYSGEVEAGGEGAAGDGAAGLVPPRPLGAGAGPSMANLDDSLDVTADANAFSAADDDEDAAMMRQAMELVVRSQLGSTSMLQRKLKVGFARAGRIMDLLEQRGVVGPSEGSKARAVLMTVEEFELLQQSGQL